LVCFSDNIGLRELSSNNTAPFIYIHKTQERDQALLFASPQSLQDDELVKDDQSSETLDWLQERLGLKDEQSIEVA
jgi:hypothetical protein